MGEVIFPPNWLDRDAPWSLADDERTSLDASEPPCDHIGEPHVMLELCQCGELLGRTVLK